jgi:hypothetical protein
MGSCLQLMILNQCGNERLNETNSGSNAAVVTSEEIGREWLDVSGSSHAMTSASSLAFLAFNGGLLRLLASDCIGIPWDHK